METFTIEGLPIVRNFADGSRLFGQDVKRIASRIESVKDELSHFKIGKTGNTVDERSAQSDYCNKYDGIVELYVTSSKTLVSRMEASLIEYFKSDPECDNDKGGSQSLNDEVADSARFVVYMVFKLKRNKV